MKKELFKITVIQDEDDSLIATAEYDGTDDVFGNLAFAFMVLCKNMNMTSKEALKYLKDGVKLWEEYQEKLQ